MSRRISGSNDLELLDSGKRDNLGPRDIEFERAVRIVYLLSLFESGIPCTLKTLNQVSIKKDGYKEITEQKLEILSILINRTRYYTVYIKFHCCFDI